MELIGISNRHNYVNTGALDFIFFDFIFSAFPSYARYNVFGKGSLPKKPRIFRRSIVETSSVVVANYHATGATTEQPHCRSSTRDRAMTPTRHKHLVDAHLGSIFSHQAQTNFAYKAARMGLFRAKSVLIPNTVKLR